MYSDGLEEGRDGRVGVSDHGCELAVEGLSVVIGLAEVAGGPVNKVPGKRQVAGRFGAAGSGYPFRHQS